MISFLFSISNVFFLKRSSSPKIQNRNYHDNPVFMSNNTRTYVAIYKTVDSKLGEPYNSCLKDEQLFKGNKTIIDYILNSSESYSQIKCLEYCFYLDYIQQNKCNCSPRELDNVRQRLDGLLC